MNTVPRACLTAAVTLVSACGGNVQSSSMDVLSQVDHLVYATTDLERGIADIEQLTGVRASPGGQHPGRGTHNALLSLGPDLYLEIIARDPAQPEPTAPRAFGLDTLTAPRLVTWSAKGTQLDQLHRTAADSNIALGPYPRAAGADPMACCCRGSSPILRSKSAMVSFRSSSTGDRHCIRRKVPRAAQHWLRSAPNTLMRNAFSKRFGSLACSSLFRKDLYPH